ncbi:MAG: pyrroline-5-carboxylate reductase family protein [Ruminococcus sp.]
MKSTAQDRRCSDRRDGSGLYRCRHRCGLYPENDKALCKSGSGDAEHTLLLGEGATALAKDDAVSDAEFAVVQRIFGSCGMTAVIAPEQMKEVIAINGSSPAFIYLFAKSFLDYAAKVGLPETSAKELFAQSLIGSAKMITDSGYSIDELIRQVSSPGGTTLAGLDQLYEGKLSDAVRNACESCTKRAYELAK